MLNFNSVLKVDQKSEAKKLQQVIAEETKDDKNLLMFFNEIGNCYLLCLNEVQRFSVWRALGATLIPFMVLLVRVGVCVLLAGL